MAEETTEEQLKRLANPTYQLIDEIRGLKNLQAAGNQATADLLTAKRKQETNDQLRHAEWLRSKESGTKLSLLAIALAALAIGLEVARYGGDSPLVKGARYVMGWAGISI